MSARRDLFAGPDRSRSLRNYRELAAGYDASCTHILTLREAAVAALALRPGETVFDIACGTGAVLAALDRAVSPGGRVIGIEQCPEMAHQAAARARPLSNTRIVVSSIEELQLGERADAMLFCYTHDVLQSHAAIERLRAHAKPGCRVAVLGIRLQPWSWGFALNLFTLARARRYFTTYRGLHRPWALLATACPDLAPVRHFHAGTSYLAVGRFS